MAEEYNVQYKSVYKDPKPPPYYLPNSSTAPKTVFGMRQDGVLLSLPLVLVLIGRV